MINFDEELAKFKPSKDVEQVEDLIVNRDLTDVTDILIQMMKNQDEENQNRR